MRVEQQDEVGVRDPLAARAGLGDRVAIDADGQ